MTFWITLLSFKGCKVLVRSWCLRFTKPVKILETDSIHISMAPYNQLIYFAVFYGTNKTLSKQVLQKNQMETEVMASAVCNKPVVRRRNVHGTHHGSINWTEIQQKRTEMVHTCTNESTINTRSNDRGVRVWRNGACLSSGQVSIGISSDTVLNEKKNTPTEKWLSSSYLQFWKTK